ncbi:hypothetical protein AUC68_02505 [Methyloceanibacter methanicus]|uniref:FIST domain containing protein n=1 Tax=Methyloceanibacter methanicus TaxID=1774968 RepID=A0A1E3W2G1_9HYPH|nr:FIST N-terminal domain-containing protein [Methyloceanibacter methanicus]ODR99994.1 hypothetical protein AUC68_02505 [Methyloceanibacter methanicus]
MRRAHANRRACGVQTAWTSAESPEAAVAAIAEVVDPSDLGQLLVFFSQPYQAEALSQALSEAFPGVPVAGCSTSGEITPAGFSERSVLVVAFPKTDFRFVSRVIPEVRALSVERATEAVQALRQGLDRVNGKRYQNLFAVSLIDGLSRCEEAIVSAIAWALGDIPLVGGSAGDGLTLSGTSLLHDGQVHRGAALLLLVETAHPVRSFYCDHFEPTETKLVVTSSDASTRTVYELNAEPAAQEYASSVGLEPSSLAPMSFAAIPTVRIGGDYYCRSIQRVNDDGSLSFFCAIDDGVVLTVAEPRDMVKSMEAELEHLDTAIGGVDFVLGFECVLRRLDAENRQVKHKVSDLYRRYHVVGFHTYGEQYNAMHLNQTFTGVAIGRHGTS